jgi:hypothetical protein
LILSTAARTVQLNSNSTFWSGSGSLSQVSVNICTLGYDNFEILIFFEKGNNPGPEVDAKLNYKTYS